MLLDSARFLRRRSVLVSVSVAVLTVTHFIVLRPAQITTTTTLSKGEGGILKAYSTTFAPSSTTIVKKAQAMEQEEEAPLVDIASLWRESRNNSALQARMDDTPPRIPTPPPTAPKGPPPPSSFNFAIGKPEGCELDLSLNNVTAEFSSFPQKISLNDLMEVVQAGQNPGRPDQGDDDVHHHKTRVAMCKLRQNGNYAHFPHMMQQFTRCFSFYQIFSSYDRYLYMYTHVHATSRGADLFNKGMFAILQDIFNVTVVYDFEALDEDTLLVKPFYDMGLTESLQQGIVFQSKDHAKVFRDKVQAYYGIESGGCKPQKTEPVIGILNRKPSSNRTIINLERFETYLGKLTSHPVQVKYFEGTTFMEQITFMSNIDILISPHGAQLTSLNFMPPCGGVFELFPPGYYLPHFFGPLATTSGLLHGYAYTGANVQTEWYEGNLLDRKKRFRARDQNVCVPLEKSLDIIGKMVDGWKECCRDQ